MVAGIWLAGSTNRHIASDFRWLMSGAGAPLSQSGVIEAVVPLHRPIARSKPQVPYSNSLPRALVSPQAASWATPGERHVPWPCFGSSESRLIRQGLALDPSHGVDDLSSPDKIPVFLQLRRSLVTWHCLWNSAVSFPSRCGLPSAVLNDILGQLFLGVLFFYWRRAWVLKPRPPPPAYVRFCGPGLRRHSTLVQMTMGGVGVDGLGPLTPKH